MFTKSIMGESPKYFNHGIVDLWPFVYDFKNKIQNYNKFEKYVNVFYLPKNMIICF